MSPTPDLSSILDDLAAGRIDAAEATRRIEAASRGAAQQPADADADRDGAGPTGPAAETNRPDESGQGRAEEPPTGPHQAHDAPGQSRHGLFDEPWNRVPPEAREGLRSAWQRVTGVAEQVADAASGSRGSAGPGGPGPDPSGQVSQVRVRCVGRRVTIIGDPATPGVKVEGEHIRRRVGEAVEISAKGHIGPDLSGLLKFRLPKDTEDLKDLGLGPELVIRMHPDLGLDIELSGGALRLLGVPVVDSVRVTAGAADIADVHRIEDALFQVGGATVTGPVDQGRSRIRVESGNLSVRLTGNANVAVRADTQTSVVSWPDGGSEVDEYVVGNGAARLDLSAVMGRISVRLV